MLNLFHDMNTGKWKKKLSEHQFGGWKEGLRIDDDETKDGEV